MTRALREQHTAHTRQVLIEAAIEVFTELGYAGASIDDVVTHAGVTRGALYHHFDSKLELFRAACEAVEGDVVGQVQAAAEEQGSVEQRAGRAIRAYFTACRAQRYQAIALREGHNARLGDTGVRYSPALLALVRHLYEQLTRAGAIDTENEPVAAPGMPIAELRTRLTCAMLCEAAYALGAADDPESAKSEAMALTGRLLFGRTEPAFLDPDRSA